MSDGAALIYEYDGSFDGLLCCIHESISLKEVPLNIILDDTPQEMLFRTKRIETDEEKASQVWKAVESKLGHVCAEQARLCFLTCAENKEMLIYKYIRKGFRAGKRLADMLADETVNLVDKTVLHMSKETHLYKGFVRFSVHGDVKVAVIEPKNFVLPMLLPHFCNRYADENFMIFDKTNDVALIHTREKTAIVPVQDIKLPEADGEEILYQNLWRGFYKSISNKQRENPRCRMSHMPKRYWKYLTELQPMTYKCLPGKTIKDA